MIFKIILTAAASVMMTAVCVWIAWQCFKDFRVYWREFRRDLRKEKNHE